MFERAEVSLRPLVEADGFDLIFVEWTPQILRLYIDKEGGVSVDDCATVARTISDVIDAEGLSDSFPGKFNLEVSSPGLDRPLSRPKDFCRFVGREVKVSTVTDVSSWPDRKNFRGVLLRADEMRNGGIEIEVDKEQVALAYDVIKQARLVPV